MRNNILLLYLGESFSCFLVLVTHELQPQKKCGVAEAHYITLVILRNI